jgi:protein SCO1/2
VIEALPRKTYSCARRSSLQPLSRRAQVTTCWLLISITVALSVSQVSAAGAGFRSGVLEPPRLAPEIALKAHDGSDFRLSRHRGDVVAIVFGYTFCPDVCPTTLAELAQVRSRLGSAAKRLRVVFVTVDPDRDGPDRLRAYTQAFDRTFVGLTGSPEQLTAVQKSYGVVAQKKAVRGTAAAYLVDHSAFVYVVDTEGQLRLMFPFGTSIDDMTHDIGLLLRR